MSLFCICEDPTGSNARYGADVTTLVVTGEVDYGASPHLRERIHSAIRTGGRYLVLDLSAVTFIDSSAIGVLIGAATRLQESASGSLAIVCAQENERVLRIFDIAGVASLIALYPTQDDARTALDPAQPMHLCGSAAHAMAGAPADRLDVSAATAKAEATWRYAEAAAVRYGADSAVHAERQHTLDELA
jgi:anti-sigma B factor antagonist